MHLFIQRFFIGACLAVGLAACGGGGGGAAPGQPGGGPQPTQAVLRVFIQGTLPQGSAIGSTDVTVKLPAGVTAKADAITGETQTGVVVASGVAIGSTVAAKYTAAVAPTAGTVRIGLINSTGFAPGEIVTLNLDVSGSTPFVNDFSTTGLTVSDGNGVALNGLSAALALQLL